MKATSKAGKATGPSAPTTQRDRIDADYAEASGDVECIHDLVTNAERSAGLVDDGINATEASEERTAAAEAQAMR